MRLVWRPCGAIFLAAVALCAVLVALNPPPGWAAESSKPEKPTAAQLDSLGTRSTTLDSLEAKTGRNRLTRMLSDYVFTRGGGQVDPATLAPGGSQINESATPYEAYAGRIIRRIGVVRLDLFTGVESDTTAPSQPWLYRVGNAVHKDTRESKIESFLFFSEGEPLDPNDLADTERILRNQPFIQDARVAIVQIPDVADSVDVIVVTRDVWSIGVTAKASSRSHYTFKLFDRNLFGLGHNLENEFDVDSERSQELNYKLTYRVNNVYSTFIDGLFEYRNTHLDETISLGYARGFISPQIRWAGALTVSFNKLKSDTSGVIIERFDQQDFWIGRSFELWRDPQGRHSRKTFVLAARTIRTDFHDFPETVDPSDRTFTDKTVYLWSMSLAKNEFSKGRLILGFGRTEDIPRGYLLDVTLGHELARGIRDREYAGIGFRAGGYKGKLGYITTDIEAGAYLLQRNAVDAVLDTRLGYFTNLIPVGRYALRQFLFTQYTLGLRRTDVIDLDDEGGIRGLNDVDLEGLERLNFRLQTVFFTPWNWFGFKTAIFGEADAGAIGPRHESVDDQRFYTSWGLGVRIDNERLAFDPFEIRVNFYPSPPEGQNEIRFFFTNVRNFPINGFAPGAPSTVGFR